MFADRELTGGDIVAVTLGEMLSFLGKLWIDAEKIGLARARDAA